MARIGIGGQKIYLGYFKELEDAIAARKDSEELFKVNSCIDMLYYNGITVIVK